MGFIDSVLALFGRGRGEEPYEDERLVPGPQGRNELSPEKHEYGRLGGARAVDELHERLTETGEETAGPEDDQAQNPTPPGHRTGMLPEARRFIHRLQWPRHLLRARTIRRFEKGLSAVESATTLSERQSAEQRFRRRTFLSKYGIKRKLDEYAKRELGELEKDYERELKHLEQRGADPGQLEHAERRFSEKQRRLSADLNRRLYRPLRGIARRSGLSSTGRIRPPF